MNILEAIEPKKKELLAELMADFKPFVHPDYVITLEVAFASAYMQGAVDGIKAFKAPSQKQEDSRDAETTTTETISPEL